MSDLTALYVQAHTLLEAGERVMSTDEMTGIQALERKHPTIGMGPGRVERRERPAFAEILLRDHASLGEYDLDELQRELDHRAESMLH